MLDTNPIPDANRSTVGSTIERKGLRQRLSAFLLPGAALSPGREFARQVVLILAAVLLYFGVRGLTQGNVDAAVQNGHDVLDLESRLGIDIEDWAQGLIIDHHWLVTAVNWIYIWGHWPVIAITLIWLHHTRRYDYLLLRNAMFLSGAIGLIIFATYAVAPPRLLDVGLADTVTQHSNAYRILQPPALVNKYAAIPSLHVGWNLLIGIALFRAASRPFDLEGSRRWRLGLLKLVAVISPVLMAVTVVLTANHYVIDGVLGAALALLGLWLAHRFTTPMTNLDYRLRTWLHDRPAMQHHLRRRQD